MRRSTMRFGLRCIRNRYKSVCFSPVVVPNVYARACACALIFHINRALIGDKELKINCKRSVGYDSLFYYITLLLLPPAVSMPSAARNPDPVFMNILFCQVPVVRLLLLRKIANHVTVSYDVVLPAGRRPAVSLIKSTLRK